jgi:D-aminoacyl-tRNA deacylase
MYLIVISAEDPASVNICERLLEHSAWNLLPDIEFDGNKVFIYKTRALLVTINSYHLFNDNIDVQVREKLGAHLGTESLPTAVIFASKHKSASGLKTLTVHPLGNFNKAEYGGKPEELVPTAPHLMTMAYRILYQKALEKKLEHSVSFEATHHGPYLETPSFFIEIGSDESAWSDKDAANVLALTIIELLEYDLETNCKDYPITIGIGGGHYAPRHSDVARKKRISFGHIIPSYALESIPEHMLKRVVECTHDAKLVYFHKKAMKSEQYRELKSWYERCGLEVVSSDDLEELPAKYK